MKKLLLATTMMCLAAPVFAQGFQGGEVSLSFGDNQDDPVESSALDVSVVYGISSSFGLQFDLGSMTINNGSDFGTYGLHAFMTRGSAAFGIYAGHDELLGDELYGLEAAFQNGSISGTGFILTSEAFSSDSIVVGVDGVYGLNPSFGIEGSLLNVSGGSTDFGRIGLGVRYQAASGFFASAGLAQYYGDEPNDMHTEIGLGYSFGKGKVFKDHSYTSLFGPVDL